MIQRGTSAPDDSGGDLVRYLQIGADQIPDRYEFTTTQVRPESVRERAFERESRAAGRCTLRDWDILLMVGGQAGKVGLFRQMGETPCIVGHQSLILRYPYPDAAATEAAAVPLFMYLKSEYGTKSFEILAQKDKHGVRSIKIDDLLNMPLPIFSPDLTDKALKDFASLNCTSEMIRDMLSQIDRVRAEFPPPDPLHEFFLGEFWKKKISGSRLTDSEKKRA